MYIFDYSVINNMTLLLLLLSSLLLIITAIFLQYNHGWILEIFKDGWNCFLSLLINLRSTPDNIPTAKADVFKIYAGSMKYILEIHEKYGDVFKLWIYFSHSYFISDPVDIETIFTNPSNMDKSILYEKIDFIIGGENIITEKGELWTPHRKLLNTCFSYQSLQGYAEYMSETTGTALEFIEKTVPVNVEIDIEPPIKKWVFGNLCNSLMGMADENNDAFLSALQSYSKPKFSLFHLLLPHWLFNMTESGRNLDKNKRYMRGVVQEVINGRKTALLEGKQFDKKKRSLVDTVIASGRFTEEKITSDIVIILIAGFDTVSFVTCCCLYELSRNPRMQCEVYEEVKSVLPSKTAPNFSKLNDLKYLQAFIKETMRRYPATAILGRNIKDAAKLADGRTIPAGSDVYVDLYYLSHNPNIHEEPHKFNPHRFTDIRKTFSPGAYMPMGIAPRNCLGGKYAMIQMKIILAAFIAKYEILPSEKQRLIVRRSYVTQPRKGVPIILKLREES